MTREEFLRHLRDALNHLRDPEVLRQSPLAELCGVGDRFDTFSALQRILTEAIESLEPAPEEPSQSRAWRLHESLYYRYVQQFSQQQVADQIGIGTRHLRREQHAALEALAEVLWTQYDLGAKLSQDTPVEPGPAETEQEGDDVGGELAWLRECPADSTADLGEALSSVLDLGQKLADRYGVALEGPAAGALPALPVHPVALEQMLLNLISVAIHRAVGGRVRVDVASGHYEVEIRVTAAPASEDPSPALNHDLTSLKMAQRLVDLCQGRLVLSEEDVPLAATLALPTLEQLPVLVIDDSADTQQLLLRYAAGTRYQLYGTRDPEQALEAAEAIDPRIILLDVMMPQVDGWKVLGWLREHPLTGHIPVVVCTIMAQEDLALCLGAAAFVQKPVSRQDLLATLDRVALAGPGPN
jgi:CheY-like chemotaxis protein